MTRLGVVASRMRGGIHPKHLIERDMWYMDWIEEGDVVVDLGCGTGKHVEKVQRTRNVSVIGFDKDDTYGFYTDLEWCVPLPDKFADRVLLLNVFEHIDNRIPLLKNIHRILKDNGTLLMSIPNSNTSMKRFRRKLGFRGMADSDHKVEYEDVYEVSDELLATGFEMKEQYPIVIDTIWAGLIDLVGGFNLALYKKLHDWKVKKAYDNPEESTGWEIVCKKE